MDRQDKRQQADLLVLPSRSVIGTVNYDSLAFLMSQGLSQALAGQFSVEGVSLPLADKWVLTTGRTTRNITATALIMRQFQQRRVQMD